MDVAGLPLTSPPAVGTEEPKAASPESASRPEAAWSPAKRFGFRFLAAYFVLFSFPFPLNYVPWLGDFLQTGVNRFWMAVARWVGAHVLGLEGEMTVDFTGSGDRTADYVLLLVTVVLALVGAAVWTLLDRRRRHYRYTARWLEVGARYLLGLVMLGYGFVKVLPSQFPPPSLARLLEPYGDSSPMGLLWTFMGASAAYTVFAGLGEVVGGFLLFFRRTRALGALVLAGVLTNVAMLNYAYDVPVKLFSTQLLLLALGLLALDGRRLVAVFLTNETAPPADSSPLFRSRRWRIAGHVLAVLLVVNFTWATVSQGWSGYHNRGAGRQKSSLWGIHDVESFRADGEELPPLLSDEVRWHRLVVDRARAVRFAGIERPGSISIQKMDGSLERHPVELDEEAHTLTLLPAGQTSVEAAREAGVEVTDVLHYERPEPDLLVLRGRWQGAEIEVHLRARDLSSMELTGRGYHWINEVPYNR